MGIWALALVLLAAWVSAADTEKDIDSMISHGMEKAKVSEGLWINGVFSPRNTFEKTDSIYVKLNDHPMCSQRARDFFKKKSVSDVDVYVVNNRAWRSGDKVTSYVKKTRVSLSDLCAGKANMGQITPGSYDVFIDADSNGVYNPGKGDAVDGKCRIIGFEVLPEVASIALLGVGLIGVVGYARLKR